MRRPVVSDAYRLLDVPGAFRANHAECPECGWGSLPQGTCIGMSRKPVSVRICSRCRHHFWHPGGEPA